MPECVCRYTMQFVESSMMYAEPCNSMLFGRATEKSRRGTSSARPGGFRHTGRSLTEYVIRSGCSSVCTILL